MGSADESFNLTGYEPKEFFLTETYVEPTTESMPEQRIPEQRFLEDVDCDDAALDEMLEMHTENMSTTPSEKASLLVSRRLRPKERGGPLLEEQGDLLWKEVRS